MISLTLDVAVISFASYDSIVIVVLYFDRKNCNFHQGWRCLEVSHF
jgi:hypothetical protein